VPRVEGNPYSEEYTGTSIEPPSQNATIVQESDSGNAGTLGKLDGSGQPQVKIPTSTANFGVSGKQLEGQGQEAKKLSAMDLMNVSSEQNSQHQMTHTQANRTTQNLATVKTLPLDGGSSQHAQSMPKKKSIEAEYSIP